MNFHSFYNKLLNEQTIDLELRKLKIGLKDPRIAPKKDEPDLISDLIDMVKNMILERKLKLNEKSLNIFAKWIVYSRIDFIKPRVEELKTRLKSDPASTFSKDYDLIYHGNNYYGDKKYSELSDEFKISRDYNQIKNVISHRAKDLLNQCFIPRRGEFNTREPFKITWQDYLSYNTDPDGNFNPTLLAKFKDPNFTGDDFENYCHNYHKAMLRMQK